MYDVLIVDDDRTSRYMLKRYKQWEGFGLTIAGEACDGKEALRKMSSRHFDLLLTDIKMPGMDGIELLKELKLLQWDICVVFLSTHSDFNYARQGIRWGVFDYMTKPIDERILAETLKRVKEHLDNKAMIREAGEKNLMDDSLKQFYPLNGVRTLSALLLAGSPSIMEEARRVVDEIDYLPDPGVVKLMENIMIEVKEGIGSVFPWLEKVEGEVLACPAALERNKREMEELFLQFFTRGLEVIRKYELHQTDGIVKRTCNYVIDHVESNITLDAVAREIQVSKDYIGRLFKQKTGSSFHEYVTKIKMEHAKYLIRSGCYKNYEISGKLGYRTSDYFSQLFKEYTGYTPSRFKKLPE